MAAGKSVRTVDQSKYEPVLILQGDSTQHREWALKAPQITIGRAPDNDIVFSDRGVSRFHAVIRREKGRWLLADRSSRNSTYLNGERLERPRFLEDGDRIEIAARIQLLFVDSEETVPVRDNRGAPPDRIRLDTHSRRVWICGEELEPSLSASQYNLLALLVKREGEVVLRKEVVKAVWPDRRIVSEQSIDSLVWRLRRRIAEKDPDRDYIVTLRGQGFRLEELS